MPMSDMIFLKSATACPVVKVADVSFNIVEIKKLIDEAVTQEIKLLVFPELSITAYTCGDLFFNKQLLVRAESGLKELCDYSNGKDMLIAVGAPIPFRNALYNSAIFLKDGSILGIVPKSYVPNYGEFYEKRWFTSGLGLVDETIDLAFQQDIPFGSNLIFRYGEIKIAAEICEDLWATLPPSSYLAVAGANVICNLSASNELISKREYREQLVSLQSARCMCAYLYASAGVHESTTDLIFGGHMLTCENGTILKENTRFFRKNSLEVTILDIGRLEAERLKNEGFLYHQTLLPFAPHFVELNFETLEFQKFDRPIDPHPFIPSDETLRAKRCAEILNMQCSALAKRMEHTGIQKFVIGISGGLDSTLALLVSVRTADMLGLPRQNVLTVTMPGFGTTDRTYTNAVQLCKKLDTSFREINIVNACLQHFKDIGHDAAIHDVTYENVQARERTQILMDIANREGGLLVGTGDLSELALGWCTYNGDHMSMYAVNCSIPKTLIRYIVKYVADKEQNADISATLLDVLDTPVSPELLPKDKDGKIAQKTEDIVGPYELHDFFLYYFIKQGATPERILFFAKQAFHDTYSEEIIEKWFQIFIRRFFTQQFKRSAVPDGPKLGSISLSPRGDWRMPSDASFSAWMEQ